MLETARLIVRDWQPDDWLNLRTLATDPRVLRYIGNGDPWPDERIQHFVNSGIEKSKTRGWIIWPLHHKLDNRFIGFCGFNDAFLPEVEIGWWLLPEYWGQDLATEAAAAILQHGFQTHHFPSVISVTQPENTASIRVMEKLGMQKDRNFIHNGHSVVAYKISNPEITATPTAPPFYACLNP